MFSILRFVFVAHTCHVEKFVGLGKEMLWKPSERQLKLTTFFVGVNFFLSLLFSASDPRGMKSRLKNVGACFDI